MKPRTPNPREIRVQRGWNTKQLAAAVGVSSRTVEGWEGGRPISKSCQILLAGLQSQKTNDTK